MIQGKAVQRRRFRALWESSSHSWLPGQREHLGNYRPNSLTWAAEKVMEKLILESTAKHRKDKVSRTSQPGLAKGRWCLACWTASGSEGTRGWVRRAGDAFDLDFRGLQHSLSNSHWQADDNRLWKWTVRGTQNWLNGSARGLWPVARAKCFTAVCIHPSSLCLIIIYLSNQ